MNGFSDTYDNNQAQPKLYMSRFSSTLLMLAKLLEGIGAGAVLVLLVKTIFPYIQEIVKGTFEISKAMEEFISAYHLEGTNLDLNLDAYVEVLSKGVLPVLMFAVMFILIILELLLVMVEAFAAVFLRITWRGASVIKLFHYIFMTGAIIQLASFAYNMITEFLNILKYRDLPGMDSQTMQELYITLGITAAIGLISFLLVICYHKDIALAMKTVSYETRTRRLGRLQKTHLSGISFFFGVCFLIAALPALVILADGEEVFREFGDNFKIYFGLYAGLFLVMAVKQFCVSACNRNLKRAR